MKKQEQFTNPTNTEKQEVHWDKIKELEKPLAAILLRLAIEIKKGTYTTIIGDDASGRIPTLILRKTINQIYEKINKPAVKTYFLAGSGTPGALAKKVYDKKENKILEFLQKTIRNTDRGVLVVTDTVATGNSLRPLVKALGTMGLYCDVATIASYHFLPDEIEGVFPIFGMNGTPSIYGDSLLSGVKKKPESLHAVPRKKVINEEDASIEQDNAKILAEARQDVGILANKLADEFIAREFPHSTT